MTVEELTERARTLIGHFERFRIVGDGWGGNVRDGFAFKPEGSTTLAQAPGVGVSGPPIGVGACCHTDDGINPNGVCSIETEAFCVSCCPVWIFKGVGTSCSPTLCPASGACCFPDSSCVLHTHADCDSLMGTYKGDGTVCTPNPCCDTCGVTTINYTLTASGGFSSSGCDISCSDSFSCTVSGSQDITSVICQCPPGYCGGIVINLDAIGCYSCPGHLVSAGFGVTLSIFDVGYQLLDVNWNAGCEGTPVEGIACTPDYCSSTRTRCDTGFGGVTSPGLPSTTLYNWCDAMAGGPYTIVTTPSLGTDVISYYMCLNPPPPPADPGPCTADCYFYKTGTVTYTLTFSFS